MSKNEQFFTNVDKCNYGTYKNNCNKLDSAQKLNYITHIIQSGDTLTSIAIKYCISIGNLKQYNNMFSNDVSFMKVIKIPISSAISNISSDDRETCNILDEPDLIKDHMKLDCKNREPDDICSSNTFLQKLDQEILQAKSNLDKLSQKSLIRDSQFGLAQSSSSPSALNRLNTRKHSKDLNVRIKMSQDNFQNSRYSCYNSTFKDNFFDL